VRMSVWEALDELADELPRVGRITFRRLTGALVERVEIIVRFLAVLELYKQGLVDLDQGERFGDIKGISYYAQLGEGIREFVPPLVPQAPGAKPLSTSLEEIAQAKIAYERQVEGIK